MQKQAYINLHLLMEAIRKHKAVCHAEPVGLHWMIGPIINIPNIACTVKCFLEPIWNEGLQALKDIFQWKSSSSYKALEMKITVKNSTNHRKNTKLGPWQAWYCVQESRGVSISRASFFPHRSGNRIRTLFPTTQTSTASDLPKRCGNSELNSATSYCSCQ